MSRARVHYTEKAHRVILTYRLPDNWLVLSALLWCLVGGLAAGIGTAVMLVVASVIGARTAGFGLTAVVITGVVTVLLYALIYLRGLRARFLQITFDYTQCIIEIDPVYSGQRRMRYAFDDVAEFHVVDCSMAQQPRCALVMERRSGPETLLELNRRWDDEPSALAQFAARLDAQLSIDPTGVDDDLPTLPEIFTVAPPVPARRWSTENDDDGASDALEVYDLDHQQSPK